MKWTKLRLKTVSDAEDIIISTLYDVGLEGAICNSLLYIRKQYTFWHKVYKNKTAVL